ncbi:MAG: hypothetical protein HFG81_02940 [Dorea sp.]|jgi:ABC-type uncharacterized transport system permease subunit|uniref:ABC transporter permease n=1 Tax=Sporofaciens musculi TaxID=2681861 RepID=UPI0021706EA3|nr:ABC-2 family transporter protein [Sporofaciens musculi]MCI9421655.1 hypothetical protein [Dorea sp.]
MKRLAYYIRLWMGYQRMGLVEMTQYPADTVILVISLVLREAAGFIGVLAIASAVGGLGGWGIYEICLMFSMCALVESLSQTYFDNVWGISYLVHEGRLDVLLVRPAPVFFQVLGDVMHYPALISMAIYAGVMVYALEHLGIGFGVGLLLFLAEYLICGIAVNTGIYTIFNCLNFWIVQGEDVAVLVQTCREFAKYPIGAFPGVIRTIFTYVLPFGFVGYYPAAYLTGKTGSWVLAGLPLSAVAVAAVAAVFWRLGSRAYDSTGT